MVAIERGLILIRKLVGSTVTSIGLDKGQSSGNNLRS